MFNHILSVQNTQCNPAKTSHSQHLRRLRGLRRTIEAAVARGDYQLVRALSAIEEKMAVGAGR